MASKTSQDAAADLDINVIQFTLRNHSLHFRFNFLHKHEVKFSRTGCNITQPQRNHFSFFKRFYILRCLRDIAINFFSKLAKKNNITGWLQRHLASSSYQVMKTVSFQFSDDPSYVIQNARH